MKKQKRRPPLLTMLLAMAARPVIGGQAVIEGVMMRSPHSFAVAVRRPDDTIVVREKAWLSLSERFPILKWPLLRGANMLIESMYNGLSALNFSASQALVEEDSDDDDKGGGFALWLTMAMSLGFAILIFKGVPHLLTTGLGEVMATEGGDSALPVTGGLFHLVDGGIRLLIFIGYIVAISMMNDVKRLFMYHGAEHKSVHTWENELPLDVENTRPMSTAHPRCGTSLILLVIAVSVFVFAALIPWLPVVSEVSWQQSIFAFFVKVPLLLPVAGVAYEAQRLAAKKPDNFLVKALIAPGMLMQRLTTREPTDKELEVALTALRKAVWRERAAQAEEIKELPAQREETLEVFEDFAAVTNQLAA
jgi:uncharacterized protein YqhQ